MIVSEHSMRPPKIAVHGSVQFITTSIEQGILLPPTKVLEQILWSVLARAQTLHPVRVSHLVVEGTHVHMVVVVDNPDDIKGFMERFKTESAHAINALLGRRKRTVWCEGYDSPTVLTLEDAIEKIVYTYTNPAKDGLETSIQNYPGLSSWHMYTTGQHTKESLWIRRPYVRNLACYGASSEAENESIVHTFTLYPDAWMDCFGVSPEERESINQSILRQVSEREKEYQEERKRKGIKVIGRKRLIDRGFDINYVPQRYGKRMWCICSDVALRHEFINWVKQLLGRAKEVLAKWKLGDFSLPYPIGLYPPSLPKQADWLSYQAAC